MNIGERLKQLRTERGYSQEDVAKLIGVGRTTYLKYENGDNKPTRKLKELSALFGVTTDYLLGNDTPESSQIPSNNQKLLDLLKDMTSNTDWQVILNAHGKLTDQDVARIAADVKHTIELNEFKNAKKTAK